MQAGTRLDTLLGQPGPLGSAISQGEEDREEEEREDDHLGQHVVLLDMFPGYEREGDW